MKKLAKQQIEQINQFLKKGQALPEEYKSLLFEGKKEYELIYNGKEREEDIIAETMAVPLQPVKIFGKDGNNNGWTNKLIFGDNLQVLKAIYDDQRGANNLGTKNNIKLIYIDPPFATKQEFRGSKEQKAYADKIIGSQFLEFLRKRLVLLREILADDGSIYVHLDWKKVHYVKALLDEVLGEENFVREIIWRIGWVSGFKSVANNWIRNHETILFYAKDASNFVFNKMYLPYPKGYERWGGRPKGQGLPIEDVWGVFEKEGVTSLAVVSFAQQDTGYPTQKPEGLLARIIKASSNPGDIVLDAFTGSGTTLAVAEKLGRCWIGIDSSKLAIYTKQKRILNLKVEIGNKGKSLKAKPFTLFNAGLYDYKLIKDLPLPEYRDFALKLFQCRDEKHKVSGIELDGYLGEYHVLVFQWHDGGEIILDRGYIDDLYKTIGKKVGRKFFIIAPASTVVFLEDYIEKDDTKYYILRIPYSIIEEIHEKGFSAIKQPVSESDVNNVVDSVGFDFVQIPDAECEYKIRKIKGKQKSIFEGDEEATIKIKRFKSNVLSRKPVEFKNLETLSMVMIDYDFNGEVFDIDDYWFADQITKDSHEVIFDPRKVGKQMMIIYMDIFGNEKREIKTLKDFKR